MLFLWAVALEAWTITVRGHFQVKQRQADFRGDPAGLHSWCVLEPEVATFCEARLDM